MTKTKKILIVFGSLFVLGAIASNFEDNAKEAVIATETPEQKAERELESKRFILAGLAKATIKEAARNPDSVSFSFVGVNKDATTVCVEYRAQNGFGGMNKDYIAFHNGKVRESVSFWNNNCTKSLYTY